MNVTNVAMPNAPMAAAIGTAVVLPPMPTSGAATAPMVNCNRPSNAAALPAVRVLASASAVAFGAIRPRLATITKREG